MSEIQETLLLPKILMILITQSTAVLHKYLNDELKYFVCYNFSMRLHRIPCEFPEFSMFREIPEYSRFSRFVATLSSSSILSPAAAALTSSSSTSYHHRVHTDIKNTVFQDLQKPNSRVFQDSENALSRSFQDTLRSQSWLHEVKKCTYQISF